MPGMVKQAIYISNVTPGITVTITEVEIIHPPEGEWTADFVDAANNTVTPHEVGALAKDVLIGTVKFENTKLGGGHGPSVKIKFKVSGQPPALEATDKICDCPPDNQAIYQPKENDNECVSPVSGVIVIHATKWGIFTRPDYVIGEVELDNGPHDRWEYQIDHIGSMPPEAHLVIAVDRDLKQWGVHVDLTKNLTETIIEKALGGIFFVHFKLFGWVLGKFNPIS